MKRILVTGGAGFIGSHIVELFQGKCEIRVLDSFRNGRRSNLDLDCELIEGDVKHSTACVDKLQATGDPSPRGISVAGWK